MDAYHNVNSGTACPAVIVTRAISDPRVPGQAATFAARLQPASSVDCNASHGSTKSLLDDQLANEDDQLANEEGLPLWPLGEPVEPRAGVAL